MLPVSLLRSLNVNGFYLTQQQGNGVKLLLNRLQHLLSAAVQQGNPDLCLAYYTARICERQVDQGRVCKWINTVVMDISLLADTCACASVCVKLSVLPVAVCCCQAV